MKLSVIVPVYNEANTVLQIIEQIRRVEIGMDKEIIVLDGNSTDGTKELLKKEESKKDIKVIYETKKAGKGAAIRKGFETASGDLVLIQDADLELTPDEYPVLLKAMKENKCDAVYGSRFYNGRGKIKLASYLANRAVTFATNLLFASKLTDVATCYKLLTKEIVSSLRLQCSGFDIDIEITAKLLKNKKTISEVPVTYNPRTYEEGKKLLWRDGFISLYILLITKFSNGNA